VADPVAAADNGSCRRRWLSCAFTTTYRWRGGLSVNGCEDVEKLDGLQPE
jgi:hypothetical protein